MGLFSLFRKDKPAVEEDEDEAYARLAANSELQRREDDSQSSLQMQRQLDLQRDIARATVLKIDAIEAAMAADMFDEPAFRRPPRRAAPPAEGSPPDEAVTELLEDDDIPVEAAAAESAPVVEEAAILYANGEADEACRLLAAAVHGGPASDRTAWWMLFDLYAVLGRQEAFDSLSIDYASTFETSPPPWNPALADDTATYSGVTPTATLAGVLDAATSAQIAHLRRAAEGAAVLRLDFSRVTAVEPDGCALLHDTLREVQQGRELILGGAEELLRLVRAMVDVGRRDDGAAPWLLLLELLRLLNREKEFEEAAMDYCVTFEVSPPPFTPPGKVASTPRQLAAPAGDRYLLPRLIEGNATEVWSAIRDHAERGPALVFDCSRLARIDYTAAGHLLALLQQLAGPERRIEFRELNHMVAALARLLGYGSVARLLPHRY
ncbi:STAS domain-containing protein [Pseudoduganella sp. SL102]|uniref:STAS domain-containing protein n=1 Tax=Pseudoduganella sp. SL102 TaxID=2995154 RepID=UPI00248D320F|nr:STAS domain-containing protein [Pseudoduganella sp. SL102]WBS03333.1 STAS domain-containing protein [Pseudoduganella sp. SL102]